MFITLPKTSLCGDQQEYLEMSEKKQEWSHYVVITVW